MLGAWTTKCWIHVMYIQLFTDIIDIIGALILLLMNTFWGLVVGPPIPTICSRESSPLLCAFQHVQALCHSEVWGPIPQVSRAPWWQPNWSELWDDHVGPISWHQVGQTLPTNHQVDLWHFHVLPHLKLTFFRREYDVHDHWEPVNSSWDRALNNDTKVFATFVCSYVSKQNMRLIIWYDYQ